MPRPGAFFDQRRHIHGRVTGVATSALMESDRLEYMRSGFGPARVTLAGGGGPSIASKPCLIDAALYPCYTTFP